MDTLKGAAIKGYKLHELIGTGGFGAVYRASQPSVEREVAVKVILPEHANTPDFIRRFESEARLVARLEHPYIVPLYDYWRDPAGAYLVLRYLRGGSLTKRIKREGPLDFEQAGTLLTQIASALSVAHANGVIHRDLKPDNILLDEAGNYYLTDFGIAKDTGHETALTQAGMIVGSPAYLSPEQITGEGISPLSDVYSLGILLHYALTGEHPFPGKTPTAMLVHQMHDPMPALTLQRNDATNELEQVLQRATDKDPNSRFSSVMELAIAYSRALETGSASTSQVQRRTHANLQAVGIDTAHIRNPYKGLYPFEQGDARDFFGREDLVNQLLDKLRPISEIESGARMLVLVGPSGSGKSSVVKAGLLPKLRGGALPDSEDWFFVEMVPGSHPMEELEAALLRVAVNPPESLLKQLREDERGLVRAVKRVLPDDDTELVLFIDQFEELFTLTEDEQRRNHFLNSLMNAVEAPRNRLRLILTLRADFYDRPLGYHKFGQMVREYTEVILPLSPEELERAVVLPAENAGMGLEPALSTAIVQDVREQPGALPLLQYALMQLFEERDGNLLTMDAYHKIGGAMGALAQRAEDIYLEQEASIQNAARQLFLRLVTLGEGAEDTRRRIQQSELKQLGDAETMQNAIEVFGSNRLLTFDHDPVTREPTIEVAHEALIREWRRLRDWLDGAREELRTHRRLSNATREWLNASRDDSFLASGMRLEQFENWRDASGIAMNQEEAAYLAESLRYREAAQEAERAQQAREEALERRAQARQRALLIVVSVAAVLASVLAGLAIFAQREAQAASAIAETSAETARRNAAETQSIALAANALNLLDDHEPNLALRLALEATQGEGGELTPVQQALAETAYAPGAIRQLNPLEDGASITTIDYNGSGDQFVAGSSDGRVLIMTPDGAVLQNIPAFDAAVQAVAHSPVGPVIAAAPVAGPVQLWNAESGTMIQELAEHDPGAISLAFSPDGQLLLSGGQDNRLLLWDVNAGTVLREFVGHTGQVLSVDFGPSGNLAVSGSSDDAADSTIIDRSVRIWDVQTGEQLADLRDEDTGWIRAVALSPNERVAVAASYDPNEFGGTIRVWDIDTQRIVRTLIGHTDVITTLDFSPDGQTVLSGAWDNTVRRWDVETGVQLQRFDTHRDRLMGVRFSPNGETALTTSGRSSGDSEDSSLLLLDLTPRAMIRQMEGHEDWLWSGAFTPDGTQIATGSGDLNVPEGDNSIRIWDVETGEQLQILTAHEDTVSGLVYSPDGTLLASSSWDGSTILWDTNTYTELMRLSGHEGRINDVKFSPDGTLLLTSGGDNVLRLWNIESGEQIRVLQGHENHVLRAAFNEDGTLALSSSRDGTVRLWNVRSGETIHVLTGHSGWVNTVNFSPDGQYGVSGADNDLILWDIETGTEIRRLVGHQGFVYGGAFSPDGRHIFSGASDTTVRLWEVETGEEIRRFDGHTNWVLKTLFNPEGTIAASVGEDNRLRLWRIARTTDELAEWAQENRYLPELTCAEREQYRVTPLCETLESTDLRGREGRSDAETDQE